MGDDTSAERLIVDVRRDTFLVGRSAELQALVRNLHRGRHTLITGAKGIGKTRLMEEAVSLFQGRRGRKDLSDPQVSRPGRPGGHLTVRVKTGEYLIMFIIRSSPMGDCLKEMILQLHAAGCLRLDDSGPVQESWPIVKKRLTGLGSVRLQEIIVESIDAAAKPLLIFFDSLDRISPSVQIFLENLLGAAVVCGAAVQMKEAFHFKKIWSSFVPIELGPLTPGGSVRLIHHCLETYRIRVIDRDLYTREILKSTNGNPFLIKNAIWHGSREVHVTSDEIRTLRRREEGEFFNMGPIYILLASMLTLFKIFSFGTDNREFYIYFSSLGFLVYLIFRVFRTFFLFKPQR